MLFVKVVFKIISQRLVNFFISFFVPFNTQLLGLGVHNLFAGHSVLGEYRYFIHIDQRKMDYFVRGSMLGHFFRQ